MGFGREGEKLTVSKNMFESFYLVSTPLVCERGKGEEGEARGRFEC